MTKQALKFNPNHVFVDTNVLVGGYSGDARYQTGVDIEDNVQFVLAKKQRCYIVVTNNYKDYRFLPGIDVLRPEKIRKIPQ